jgi:GMP synthase (glutamine-hydrolysing)
MKLLVVDNTEPADRNFNQPLFEAVEAVAHYDALPAPQLPDADALKRYGGIILSGVPKEYPVETIETLRHRLDPVIEAAVPVLGICLGHQSIGAYYGAPIIKDQEAEEGYRVVQILQADPLFNGMARSFGAVTMHTCSVEAPKGFTVIASSQSCKNQAMRDESGRIRSVQFHPEHSPQREAFFRNFMTIVRHNRDANALLAKHGLL